MAGDDIWKRLKSPTAWAISVGKLGLLVTREAIRLRMGTITPQQFRVRTGGHVGSSAGIILGAAAGAAAGAVVPGIGNIAGAFCGGVIGAMAGEEFGRWTASHLETTIVTDEPPPPATPPKDSDDTKPNGHVRHL
jgi:hypothetical protein